MENSTAQLETRWTLHSDLVGGEHYLFFPLVHVSSSSNVIVIYHRSGRICAGKHLAHSALTLAAASVLSTFDLVRKVDENGKDIEPKREYTRNGIR